MYVVIAGGGRTGAQLATVLVAQHHKVCLIESRPDVLSRIHHELPTEVILEGDAMVPEVLEQAHIRDAQVLAACTANDEENLVACYMARQLYAVPRTIGRINNPRNAWLFDRKFHVDVAINQADLMARLIAEEMSLGDMMTLLKLRRGEVSVVEEKIPEGARAVGVAVMDLALPDQCVIAAIIRRGDVVMPRGVTTFEVGDEVLIVTRHEAVPRLAEIFSKSGSPT